VKIFKRYAVTDYFQHLIDGFRSNPDYSGALISGYVLVSVNMLTQLALTPFYLHYLGESQFGTLMIILNLLNFVAIGIGWMSGGLTRLLGELWAQKDVYGLRQAFALGKYIFLVYAIIVIGLAVFSMWGWSTLTSERISISTMEVFSASLFLLAQYEANPERQTFVGTRHQTSGNVIEVLRIVIFSLAVFLFLPRYQNFVVILLSMTLAVLVQRFSSNIYLTKQIGELGWRKLTPAMKPLLRRLAGKQGAGYLIYGVLLICLQMDTLIIGYLGGPELAGQFSLLWRIPGFIFLIMWRIPSALQPHVIYMDARRDFVGLKYYYQIGLKRFAVIAALAALLYMIFGQKLTQIWVGSYAPGESWMYWLSGVALFLTSLARWPISFAYALIRLRPLVKIIAIELLAKSILTVLLFPIASFAAPIAATVITHGVYATWAYLRLIQFQERTL